VTIREYVNFKATKKQALVIDHGRNRGTSDVVSFLGYPEISTSINQAAKTISAYETGKPYPSIRAIRQIISPDMSIHDVLRTYHVRNPEALIDILQFFSKKENKIRCMGEIKINPAVLSASYYLITNKAPFIPLSNFSQWIGGLVDLTKIETGDHRADLHRQITRMIQSSVPAHGHFYFITLAIVRLVLNPKVRKFSLVFHQQRKTASGKPGRIFYWKEGKEVVSW
jgi:hypothetical protein